MHAARNRIAAISLDIVAHKEISASASSRPRKPQARRARKAQATSGQRPWLDPKTRERNHPDAELELMQAMQDYKQRSGRMFPTWSEVLEVLRSLGYQKRA
jgi:hypothetical protein